MSARIFLSPPHLGELESRYIANALDTNWVAPLGPHVDRFEEELASQCHVAAAAALSGGTAAIHLALLLSNVGPGDVVICPTFTFVATANPILYAGAAPLFIDSDPATWTIDASLLESELERRARIGALPKAVITVDLYGQCADYGKIEPLCNNYGIPLVEDAAEALGSWAFDRPAGSFGSFSALSFNGNKIITTSGGGALLSDDEEAVSRARFLASQARDTAAHYQHSEVGFNYRLSNVLAALGRGQLATLRDKVAARRKIYTQYVAALADLPGLTFMPEATYGSSNRWLTTLTVDSETFGATREEIRLELERNNIESRPLWKPMHLQPLFSSSPTVGGAVAQQLFDQGLCLPSGSALTAEQIGRIAEIVRSLHRS